MFAFKKLKKHLNVFGDCHNGSEVSHSTAPCLLGISRANDGFRVGWILEENK